MAAARKKATKKTTKKKARGGRKRKVLLFGGGGCHPWAKACPILKRYLQAIPGFEVDYVKEDYDAFLAERLAPYHLAVVYHTGGELTTEQKRGVVEWVASGKGIVGIHAGGCDSFKSTPEYPAMFGGTFRAHPCKRNYVVGLTDNAHPVTRDIEGFSIQHWEKWPVYEYEVHDEQYLLEVDERMDLLAVALFRGKLWPVSWVRPWGQGRVFYTALGHDEKACRNNFFRDLLVGGARWAADGKPCDRPKPERFSIG